MVPKRLLMHASLFREQCQAIVALENAKNHLRNTLQNQPKIGEKPDG